MSGYFVHGGTQFPYGQNQTQSQQTGGNQQSFFGNTSYPNTQTASQTSQFSSSGASGSNFQSNNSGFNSSQYSGTSGGSGSSYASNNNASGYGTGSANSSFNSGGGSNYGGGKSNNYGSGSYNFNKGNSGNSGNYNSYQNTQSTYEKALFNAANQYYSNRGRGSSGRGRGSFRGRGGGGGAGKGSATQNTGPKPIKASEIKAFLYAWCGQRKLKPEYEVTVEGEPPKKVMFSCKLMVSGIEYTAQVQASNKKDAQSRAAWDFCENLVKTGYMKQSELPPKPVEALPKYASGETPQQTGAIPAESPETIEENGGWTTTNARQRLNQFCQREHSTPSFKHTTLGPEHARSFTCELTIFVDAQQKEFVASETGSNKKQSTAACALSMVRQLFKANLIERHGEPLKHVSRGALIGSAKKPIETPPPKPGSEANTPAPASAAPPAVAPGQKRKADEPVDDNGNWTVDNSRQRLNQFCQTHNIPCDVIYEEEGNPGNRTYTASLNLKVKTNESPDEQELQASASGQSKKIAAQGCALRLLSQLYKLTLVEANPNASNAPNKKKQSRQRLDQAAPFPAHVPPFADYGPLVGPMGMLGFNRQVFRKTPAQDGHLNEKHRLIYPSEHELSTVQRSVRTIEQALKEVAEQLVEPETEGSSESAMDTDEPKSEPKKKSKLQGVMRVGALAKGLMLKGDMNVQLVLLCHEAPTAKLLVKVAQLLPKFIKAADSDSFSVVTAMNGAAITVTNTTIKTDTEPALTCNITVSLTSPVIRTPNEEAVKDPPGSLNKEKCLQALAELRHSKWFQACANGLPSCVVVIRILRDMTRRLKEWKPLSDWALELITEKALATSRVPLSLGSSFVRCMEVIASGVLLPGGPGISDPCERTPTDATDNMTPQEREAVTLAAQTVVREYVYRQPHKILGIEPFSKKAVATPTKEDSKMEG